ncbi:MAG: response regulator [bacterium]
MTHKILLIDDEPKVLSGYRRILGMYYDLVTEEDPVAAIQLMKKDSSFSVIISDFRMPKADGNRVLSMARDICPDAVRIMLTGNADLNVAIDAVNNGNIYRFLQKPCSTKLLKKVIDDAIIQNQLITAERDLTEKTLQGSIKILIEILSSISPATFTLVQRARLLGKKICNRINIKRSWEFELAILLSKIGYITLPQEILEKKNENISLTSEEESIFLTHSSIARKLLINIPRLENIAEAIGLQMSISKKDIGEYSKIIRDMARLLHLVLDFMEEDMRSSKEEAVKMIEKNSDDYDDDMRDALISETMSINKQYIIRKISVKNLKPGMILAAPIYDVNGILLASKSTAVTEVLKMKLVNFIKYGRKLKSIKVLMPINEKPSSSNV